MDRMPTNIVSQLDAIAALWHASVISTTEFLDAYESLVDGVK